MEKTTSNSTHASIFPRLHRRHPLAASHNISSSVPVSTFGAELGAEIKQNKGNGEERDGDEAESAVGPCAREVFNHYID